MGRKIRLPAEPFVKWVGGKRQLVPTLMKYVPKRIGTYYEPFAGGAALFFALANEQPRRFERAKLSDTNVHLMEAFHVLSKGHVDDVVMHLREHEKKHSARHYAEQRLFFGTKDGRVEQAARFLYLMRTCFNGVYRVNRRDEFNVPMGSYSKPAIVNEQKLRTCARVLSDVTIRVDGFAHAVRNAKRGDFVYFDPPYMPISATSNFTSYTTDGFDDSMHVLLRDTAAALKSDGVKVLISNSAAPRVRDLYKRGFEIIEVEEARAVNSKGSKRGKIPTLLIR